MSDKDQCRVAFEFSLQHEFYLDRCTNLPDEYDNMKTQEAWEIWQKAWSYLNSKLAASRERELKLREALEIIANHERDWASHVPSDADWDVVNNCPECQRVQERKWPPSGVCNEHFSLIRLEPERRKKAEDRALYYRMKDIASAALSQSSAPASEPAVPEGWKLVPCEPTEEMLERFELGRSAIYQKTGPSTNLITAYRWMIAAAPKEPK